MGRIGSQQIISQALPLEYRNCLYATIIATNERQQRHNKLEGFRYVDLSDHFAFFQNEDTWIFAFRGTDPSNDMRFLGVPIFTEAEKRLPYEQRVEILKPYCPANAFLGCGDPQKVRPVDTNAAFDGPDTPKDLVAGQKIFQGTSSLHSRRSKRSPWYIDSSSDCWADYHIAFQSESTSRLHQIMLYRITELIINKPNRIKHIFITGHSLGGNIAAFIGANYEGPHRDYMMIVPFDPGSGPDKTLLHRVLHRIPICDSDTFMVTSIERPKILMEVPPRTYVNVKDSRKFWTIMKILSFREENDVLSYMSKDWMPTINFQLRGSDRYLSANYHSINNMVPNDLYMFLTNETSLKDLPYVHEDNKKYILQFYISGTYKTN
jgi:hypothetical protein